MAQPIQPQVIYLVERAFPSRDVQDKPQTLIDKIKEIAGVFLAILGIIILTGASIALGAYLTGAIAITPETIHSFFLTGIICAISGFHLSKSDSIPVEIATGPVSISI